MGNVPDCTPIHCGNSLCAPGVLPCRVESTVTPFGLGIRFGDGLDKGSPEDNIGACLRFNQVNCVWNYDEEKTDATLENPPKIFFVRCVWCCDCESKINFKDKNRPIKLYENKTNLKK